MIIVIIMIIMIIMIVETIITITYITYITAWSFLGLFLNIRLFFSAGMAEIPPGQILNN